MLTGVNAVIGLAGTSLCIMTIDSIGRRPLEIYGAGVMCVTFLINAIIIKLFPASNTNTAAHWAFVALTWLFNFVFFISSVSSHFKSSMYENNNTDFPNGTKRGPYLGQSLQNYLVQPCA